MHDDYLDIRERIDEEPKWFDRHGVPRYREFSPEKSSSVYAKEVALLDVACQGCGRRFIVEVVYIPGSDIDALSLTDIISRYGEIGYGDPPRHGFEGDCSVGDVMSTVDERVIGLWRYENLEWEEINVEELRSNNES